MAHPALVKRVEFALNDLVKKRRTFSLTEVNRYLPPMSQMDFKEIFEIAHPALSRMGISWRGEMNPTGITVSVNEPEAFAGEARVVQEYFPDFMEEHEWPAIIELFKERGEMKWAKILGGLLAEYISKHPELKEVDFVSPVPCEKETVQNIGYDPNTLLANEITKETGTPLIKVFSKTRKTNLCKIKSLDEKEESIEGAFVLTEDYTVNEKHILLLDDIMDSGTTVKHLAKMLDSAGAKKVEALVLKQNQQG